MLLEPDMQRWLDAATAKRKVIVARPDHPITLATLDFYPVPVLHRRRKGHLARVILPSGRYLSVKAKYLHLFTDDDA